jgi:hypothetical protein
MIAVMYGAGVTTGFYGLCSPGILLSWNVAGSEDIGGVVSKLIVRRPTWRSAAFINFAVLGVWQLVQQR